MSVVPSPTRVVAVLVSPGDALADPPYPERAALGVVAVGVAHAAGVGLAARVGPHRLASPLLFAVVPWLVAWVAYAAVGHALTGESRRFGPTLGVVAWGFVPTLLVAVARPVRALLTPEPVGLPPRALDPGPPPELLAVGAVALAWQGYVTAGGYRALRDVSWRRAAAAAGLPLAVVLASAALAEPLADPAGLVVGVVLVGIGGLPATVPRGLLSFSAELDLVGYRGRVDPEDWYVAAHRLGGGALLLLALLVVGAGRLLL